MPVRLHPDLVFVAADGSRRDRAALLRTAAALQSRLDVDIALAAEDPFLLAAAILASFRLGRFPILLPDLSPESRAAAGQAGRRVDLAVPEASMLVEKSVGDVPHTGGKRFEKDSELNQQLIKWIAAGTPLDPANIPTCTGITIYPQNGVIDGPG